MNRCRKTSSSPDARWKSVLSELLKSVNLTRRKLLCLDDLFIRDFLRHHNRVNGLTNAHDADVSLETVRSRLKSTIGKTATSGHGRSGFTEHSKHGYGVVFALVTRPLIASIAMPLAILIYSVMVTSITSSAYKYAVPAMTADHTFGPIGMMIVLIVVGMFQVSMLIWCLNLPNIMFENINSWVDMHAGPNYRAGEAVGQIASMGSTAAAAELTTSGGGAVKNAISSAALRIPGTRAHAAANAEAGKKAGGGGGGEAQAPRASTGGLG